MPEGMSAVHLRPHKTAQEFLGLEDGASDQDLSSSAHPVFVPKIANLGL